MRSLLILSLTLFVAVAAAQTASPQPVVNAVENNFSYTLPGLPNYGIAQGSIFVIFGTNLAASSSPLQSAPLQTTLDGVSVQISVSGVPTQALLYYVTPTQVGGVLPSATPFGTGQITVTVNGQASSPAPITVVQSVFGIAPAAGFVGPNPNAGAFDSTGKALSATNAANPGDTIVFYGTGAGPVPGNEALTPAPQNLTNIPIEVDIGGSPAAVLYHGRTNYPGLDQINVEVPAGVAGCRVSLAVVSSGLVSNIDFLPVAQTGRTCSDQVPGVDVPGEVIISGKSVINTGVINVNKNVLIAPSITVGSSTTAPQNITQDAAAALFQRQTFSEPANLGIAGDVVNPSFGNCSVNTFLFPPPPSQPSQTSSSLPPGLTLLNAGPSLNFSGSGGAASVSLLSSGSYGGPISGAAMFLPASGGTLSIDNGAGGPDVGAFTAQLNLPPPLVWSNMSTMPSTIDRSRSLTVTWTGGNPAGFVTVGADSAVITSAGTLTAQVQCAVPVSAGQFTIPASAMLTLLPTSLTAVGKVLATTSLSVSTEDQFSFSAPGLDAGLVYFQVGNILTVPFQ